MHKQCRAGSIGPQPRTSTREIREVTWGCTKSRESSFTDRSEVLRGLTSIQRLPASSASDDSRTT